MSYIYQQGDKEKLLHSRHVNMMLLRSNKLHLIIIIIIITQQSHNIITTALIGYIESITNQKPGKINRIVPSKWIVHLKTQLMLHISAGWVNCLNKKNIQIVSASCVSWHIDRQD